jgi:hypothetical protein
MSQCSCGSAGCSCPKVSINDLPKGEQVVTTIKREDIPKPIKCPPPPPVVLIVTITVALTWTIKSIVDLKIELPPIDPAPDYPDPAYKKPSCPKPPKDLPHSPGYADPYNSCDLTLEYRP